LLPLCNFILKTRFAYPKKDFTLSPYSYIRSLK